MTYRSLTDAMSAPSGAPGRPTEVPGDPPGPANPPGPDIRPPPPEAPDIPIPAEVPILDPPATPGRSPPVMFANAVAAAFRRLIAISEATIDGLCSTADWPRGRALAPVRVVARPDPRSLQMRRRSGN